MLEHTFPASIIDAMARNDVLQMVVFAFLFGAACAAIGAKAEPVVKFCGSLAEVMFRYTKYVMYLAPLGVGAAIAVTVGSKGVGVLFGLGKLILTMYAALILFVVLVLGAVVADLRGFRCDRSISAVREPFLIAFSTASSEAALPLALENMEKFGVPKHIVGFVIPTGYSFNLDGTTLYLSLASMFVAQAAGVHMSFGEQLIMMLTLMLTSKGVAGVPRAALVILAGTLATFHLPVEGFAILLGVDAVLDMARTSVNVLGTAWRARWWRAGKATRSDDGYSRRRPQKSLRPQRLHRVRARRPARRDVAGERRHRDRQRAHCREGQRIHAFHFVQQRSQELRQHRAAHQARCHPDRRQPHALSQDQPHDVPPARAQRHPHTELVHPLAHRVRDHAVHSDGRQRQREGGEQGNEEQREPRRRERLSGHLLHHPYIGNRQARVEPVHHRAQLAGQESRVGPGAQRHAHLREWEGNLRRWPPEGRLGRRAVGLILNVAHHADDRRPVGGLRHPEIDSLADRVFARPVAARERLVYEQRQRRVGVICAGEEPAAQQRNSQGAEISGGSDMVPAMRRLVTACGLPSMSSRRSCRRTRSRAGRCRRRRIGLPVRSSVRRAPDRKNA